MTQECLHRRNGDAAAGKLARPQHVLGQMCRLPAPAPALGSAALPQLVPAHLQHVQQPEMPDWSQGLGAAGSTAPQRSTCSRSAGANDAHAMVAALMQQRGWRSQ